MVLPAHEEIPQGMVPELLSLALRGCVTLRSSDADEMVWASQPVLSIWCATEFVGRPDLHARLFLLG